MNPAALKQQYRLFKTNNRYSYPFLFFCIGCLKNLCQVSVLGFVGWGVYQVGNPLSGLEYPEDDLTQNLPISVVLAADEEIGAEPVEILAASHRAPVIPHKNLDVGLDTINGDMNQRQERDQVLDWEWVLKQDADKFTIQYGSSPDEELLYESARAFPTKSAVVVFPFKKTPSNRTVFGFSSGLYDTLDSAQQAIKELPQSARSFGPWIRPIGQLQKQIVVMLPG